MSADNDNEELCCGREMPTRPWGPTGGRAPREQVVYSERSGGFAYRARHFHLHFPDPASKEAAERYFERARLELDREISSAPVGGFDENFPTEFLYTLAPDSEADLEFHVDEMLDLGIDAELNYVLFADSAGQDACQCGCGVGGSPVYGSPVYGSPVYGSPVYGSPVYGSSVSGSPVYGSSLMGGGQFAGTAYASPVYGSPVYGSPVYGSPVYGSTFKSEGLRSNTARPVADGPRQLDGLPNADDPVTVVVLDTGIAAQQWRPALLGNPEQGCGTAADDPPDDDNNDYYDPASGHGTFIAGLIQQLAPGQNLIVRRVLSSFGDGDVARDIVPMLNCLRKELENAEDTDALRPDNTIINLSFSGYADRNMRSLSRAIRRIQNVGAVVVASAGNDATCRPTFPACLPGVVGVGALDSVGAAPYTNHGSWVRACAPGTDLVSTFYEPKEGSDPLPQELPVPPLPGSGATGFTGWARWSGTSFAAPIVTAALVRYMALHREDSSRQAMGAIIDAPDLYRLPGLGTVVNLVTPTPNEVVAQPPGN